jgi:transcriptional regulator with XRE-family HTH domain
MGKDIQQPSRHTWTQRSLGTAILQRRLDLGLTQAALAERVASCGDWGFRQSDISRLERGIVTLPSFTRMRSLAAALEMPVGELLARSGWAGAEEAFLATDLPPAGQDQAQPETLRTGQAQEPALQIASSDEIQELREEIVQLREAVSRLQETLASTSMLGHVKGMESDRVQHSGRPRLSGSPAPDHEAGV